MKEITIPQNTIGDIVADYPMGSSFVVRGEDGEPVDFIIRTGSSGWVTTGRLGGVESRVYMNRAKIVDLINDWMSRKNSAHGKLSIHVLYSEGWV